MPKQETQTAKREGYCPVCSVKLELNAGDLIPWHKAKSANGGLHVCSAISAQCVRFVSEETKKKVVK